MDFSYASKVFRLDNTRSSKDRAQLLGDGQGLVQRVMASSRVACVVPLEQAVCVVAAGPV